MSFTILNLAEARFDCTFGRGCDGVCCRNGRPPIYAVEAARIGAKLSSILPALRPEARAVVERDGFVSRRQKAGQPAARVVKGWCVFFHRGCVLHHAGIKPAVCAMFPLAKDERDRWYVRQKGYSGEIWDLKCLDPAASSVPASESLREEIALVESFGEWE